MRRNFFTHKNLGGEFAPLINDIRLGTPTAVFGVSDSMKYLTASLVDEPVLYVAPNAVAAAKAYSAICVLSGKKCAYLSAKDDVLLYKSALSKDAVFRRIEGIYAILSGAEVIVCDVEAAMQLVPEKLPCITLEVGRDYDYVVQ